MMKTSDVKIVDTEQHNGNERQVDKQTGKKTVEMSDEKIVDAEQHNGNDERRGDRQTRNNINKSRGRL